VGPPFQGRFKAVLHEPSIQGLVINRYIHLNPVRIGRLGGHEERSGETANRVTGELVKARVDALLMRSIFAARRDNGHKQQR
jgi:hypothetical protein